MYKFITVALVAALACVVLAADSEDAHATIVKQESNIDEHGNYNYNFYTSNHISGQESGEAGHYANGAYSYYSPEGEFIELSYKADENGFQPIGTHVHKIPEYILRALDYIRTHPQDLAKHY